MQAIIRRTSIDRNDCYIQPLPKPGLLLLILQPYSPHCEDWCACHNQIHSMYMGRPVRGRTLINVRVSCCQLGCPVTRNLFRLRIVCASWRAGQRTEWVRSVLPPVDETAHASISAQAGFAELLLHHLDHSACGHVVAIGEACFRAASWLWASSAPYRRLGNGAGRVTSFSIVLGNLITLW